MFRRVLLLAAIFAVLFAGIPLLFADGLGDPYAKKIANASDDPLKSIKRMTVPKELKAELFAAEPMLANPVAFTIDHQGRFYVAETFRLHNGVTDNRGHMDWLDDDLAATTVEDRIAFYKKFKVYEKYGGADDRVRRIVDTDGDGKADQSTIFATGFNKPEDGLASGLLARGSKVWYANIPDFWLLEDTKGKGVADKKESLSRGYGVHVSFLGHDSHGVIMGPDGKIYFSIGDRGFNVLTKEGKRLFNPHHGAVLRSDPDGANLEMVHVGLRNPQELAFDKYGNLFTGDNNADGGDQARWVHLVEGGDSGWRIGYQYLPKLGPWNAEKIWHKQHANQPASHLPPLEHVGNGPSGLTYEPGVTQLAEKYADHFFLCDFRGGSGGSGVHAFALKAKGASFEVTGRHNFVWSVLATDADFGPDGAFYVLDWTEGWGLPGKGRIFRVGDADKAKESRVAEVKKLLADGMASRKADELVTLLSHADMRVRLEAQFALADQSAVSDLQKAAATAGKSEGTEQLARLHAIWGLGQIGRKSAKALETLPALLADKDAEVRGQAAKILGDSKATGLAGKLTALLKDDAPRVRFFAAMALAKVDAGDAVPAIVEMLKANADNDPYLRHAGVMALASLDAKAIEQAATDALPAVRLAALLALRRRASPEVARFLNDVEPRVVAEAARAIYDQPIPEAMPKLAAMLNRPIGGGAPAPKETREAFDFRAAAAHFRLGQKSDALALAQYAGQANAPEKVRIDALKLLAQWEKPSGRDPVVGLWRPLPQRPAEDAADAVRVSLASIMTSSDAIRTEGAKLAAKHGIKEILPALRTLVSDVKRPVEVRLATLQALESLKDPQIQQSAELTLKDADARLRHQGRRLLLAKANPADAAGKLAEVLDKGEVAEKQGAFALLATYKAPEPDQLLGKWLDKLTEGQVPAEVQLDLLEAATARGGPLKSKVDAYESSRLKTDHLAAFREAIAGGDAEAGRRLFLDKAELSCLRCHKVQGLGGEVGPDLTGLSKRSKRDYILESLVDPNKQIAKGYESVVVTLANGQTKTGILKSDDGKEVRLMNAEGQTLVFPKAQIEESSRGPSAMPADLIKKMSKRELRDLVEYLSGL
ncbi:MAG: HEAT repeat domain-containing protein [Gemmataceae bacterium]|nr:HEAT repeat domain-containing protein [Gemmataceae bacterium]